MANINLFGPVALGTTPGLVPGTDKQDLFPKPKEEFLNLLLIWQSGSPTFPWTEWGPIVVEHVYVLRNYVYFSHPTYSLISAENLFDFCHWRPDAQYFWESWKIALIAACQVVGPSALVIIYMTRDLSWYTCVVWRDNYHREWSWRSSLEFQTHDQWFCKPWFPNRGKRFPTRQRLN